MQQSFPPDFDQAVLPHLHQAYNLARWLTRDEQDASDVVQESYLRALRYFGRFRGGDVRPWLLQIVRNTCYSWSQRKWVAPLDEAGESATDFDGHCPNPEELAIRKSEGLMLRQALESLPPRLREVVVLREFEELSYREIADVIGTPIGTVMSTLSRARARLREAVMELTGA